MAVSTLPTESQMHKFEAMTDQELRRHFLEHRDQESFHAYMDRRYARPNRKVISADDPEWEQKVIASIKRQTGLSDESTNHSSEE